MAVDERDLTMKGASVVEKRGVWCVEVARRRHAHRGRNRERE
jgi:hypothetical protein